MAKKVLEGELRKTIRVALREMSTIDFLQSWREML